MSEQPCTTPLSFEQLVDYFTIELDAAASEAIEEHVFACGRCAAELDRVERIVAAFRGQLPPVISTEQLAELRAEGHEIRESTFLPGERREVRFERGLDFMIHRLGGLALGDASRVSVTVRTESTGDVVHIEHFAPFDRSRGEVLIACQKHFAAMPHDVVFDVRVHSPSAAVPAVATYSIPHVFVQ